jgi:hypothetical protein
MDRRRDMSNVLLSGLLGPVLHTVDDAAWHSRAREVSHLHCLGLPTDLREDTALLKHLWIMEEAHERTAAEKVRGTRRKRHLYVVPDPPD